MEDPYRLLVENITDYAIYTLNPRGLVANWNRGAQRFKGYTADEIVGSISAGSSPTRTVPRGLPGHILQTAEQEGRYESEGWRVRKDGERFWAHVVIDAIRADDGKLLGFGKITRDISERRKDQERLHRLAHYDLLTTLPKASNGRTNARG